MTKFLNRLLGLEVKVQNALFKYFSDTLDAVIKQAKRAGRYDSGIIGNERFLTLVVFNHFFPTELSSDVGKVECLHDENFFLKASSGSIKIQLNQVAVDRGFSWPKALELWEQRKEPNEGFYKTETVRIIFCGSSYF